MKLFDVIIKSMRTETTFFFQLGIRVITLLMFPSERTSFRIKSRVCTWVPFTPTLGGSDFCDWGVKGEGST